MLNDIIQYIQNSDPAEQMRFLANKFPGKVVFSTSFGQEDQIITHFIFSNNLPIKVFTLDTGRMFPETYKVWARTREIYKKDIATYFPESQQVENLLQNKGPFSFYDSIENRKECCRIRKVEPLARALSGNEVWITGLRAEQSVTRTELQILEFDESHKIIKFNPLIHWTFNHVLDFIDQNNIPCNSLHDKGFLSIGCEPCTRAVKQGEDIRAGRWWWEDPEKKECGLHVK